MLWGGDSTHARTDRRGTSRHRHARSTAVHAECIEHAASAERCGGKGPLRSHWTSPQYGAEHARAPRLAEGAWVVREGSTNPCRSPDSMPGLYHPQQELERVGAVLQCNGVGRLEGFWPSAEHRLCKGL